MPLQPEPIFFRSLKRGTGSKRKLITLTNTDPDACASAITGVEKPEWIELEGIVNGGNLTLGSGKKQAIVVNVNTDHRFFPKNELLGEPIKVQLEGRDPLTFTISIQDIQEGMEDFRGVLAIDFGTTNSCFASKPRYDERVDTEAPFKPADPSDEVPSAIFFTDVSTHTNPGYAVGTEALRRIHDNAGQSYSYHQSIKRMLGRGEKYLVLDELSGSLPDHRQMWTAEEIASFVVRDVLRRAEEQLGQRITQVVATYPTLYSKNDRDAVEKIFQRALQGLGRQVGPDSVQLGLDEASAAAFNYVYNVLLAEFRQFSEPQKVIDLLAFDFGGGTIDICLLRCTLTRDDAVRISIHTDVRGVTGELHYGGDNVTLEVFRVLKNRLALLAAEGKGGAASIVDETPEAADPFASDDPFAASAPLAAAADDDPFAAPVAAAEVTEDDLASVQTEEDPELAVIVPCDPDDVIEAAARQINDNRAAIEESTVTGASIADILATQDEAKGLPPALDDCKRRANEIKRAIERILPTKFGVYEDEDPIRADLARRLFHELWSEADTLKVRVSRAPEGAAQIEADLKRIGKYTGLETSQFSAVGLTRAELESLIANDVGRAVQRAHGLWREASTTSVGGLVIGGNQDTTPLKVLIAGNSSNLAIVQRLISETFQIPASEIVRNPGGLKASVAQGAAEEHALLRDFGTSGLISYKATGLTDRIPWALGLYHPVLEGVGFRDGFAPIFERGTPHNTETAIMEGSNPLVHEGMKDLGVYCNYRDGSPPMYLGFIDLQTAANLHQDHVPPVQAAGGAETPATFGLKLTLLPDRTIAAVDMKTGRRYPFQSAREHWKPEVNPFSGVH